MSRRKSVILLRRKGIWVLTPRPVAPGSNSHTHPPELSQGEGAPSGRSRDGHAGTQGQCQAISAQGPHIPGDPTVWQPSQKGESCGSERFTALTEFYQVRQGDCIWLYKVLSKSHLWKRGNSRLWANALYSLGGCNSKHLPCEVFMKMKHGDASWAHTGGFSKWWYPSLRVTTKNELLSLGTSLVVQGLGIHLPAQEAQLPSLAGDKRPCATGQRTHTRGKGRVCSQRKTLHAATKAWHGQRY